MAASEGLTTKQSALLAALLTHAGITDAAKSVGVAERTAFRWLQEPDFQREYRAARRQVIEQALTLVQRSTGAAVATLIRNLKAESNAVQVAASRTRLEYSTKILELDDLEQQLGELQAIIEEIRGPDSSGHLRRFA
jgi:hypothetical protein